MPMASVIRRGISSLSAVITHGQVSVVLKRTAVVNGGGGGIPYNGLYVEAQPKGLPFSGWRYIEV